MSQVQPLERREKPDFERFRRVLRRQGDRDYVPFFEMIPNYLEPLSGIQAPAGLDFTPTSPRFEASVAFYFQAMARMGFDVGSISLCGFAGFPAPRHDGVEPAGDAGVGTPEQFAKYPWPSAAQIDVKAMARTAKLAPEGMGVLTGGPAPFQTLEELLGCDNLCALLHERPDFVKRVADRIGSIMLEVVELCCSLPCIEGFEVSGDLGHKTGTTISPQHLRDFILPWDREFCETAHRHHKLIILHSCGNLAAIMDDIVACGYDGKHSFEDAVKPGILALHRQYRRRLALLGGVDVDFLCRADEAAIRQRVREYIDAMAPEGGYCLGSGNSIPDRVPVASYWAMLDEGLKYGR